MSCGEPHDTGSRFTRRDAGHGAEISGKGIVRWPIGLHARLRFGPGAVQQAQHPMVEDVRKGFQRPVLPGVPLSEGVFRQVQRQGALRAPQTEYGAANRQSPAGDGIDAPHGCGGEFEGGRMRETHRLVPRPPGTAHARPSTDGPLQSTHGAEPVV
jgi:hypothetical protein